jgi:hypothetical protein
MTYGTRSSISSGAGRRKTGIGAGRFIEWLGVTASKFYGWRERYGKANEHNARVPRDFWKTGKREPLSTSI